MPTIVLAFVLVCIWEDHASLSVDVCMGSDSPVSSCGEAAKVKGGLLEWFSSLGGTVDGIEMRWSSMTERRLVASRNIPRGTEVLKIPLDLAPDSRSAADTPMGKALLKEAHRHFLRKDELNVLLLTTWLLQERASASSRWEKYITFLPPWFPNMPLNFTAQQLELCVQGLTPLENHLHSVRRNIEEHWKMIQRTATGLSIKVTKDQFLWAYSVTYSRLFTHNITKKDVEYVFLPAVDMLNHAPGRSANCAWKSDGQNSFVVKTVKALAMGEELLHDYKTGPNALFLSHYGFVEQGNPRDALDIVLPLPISDTEFWYEDDDMPLQIDGAKPANVEVITAVLATFRNSVLHAQPMPTQNGQEWAKLEILALKSLLESFEQASRIYEPPHGCPSSCVWFRESQLALIGTWPRFIKAACSLLEDSWPPKDPTLPQRFELHSRLYFGIWFGTLPKELQSSAKFREAAYFGNISYNDVADFDKVAV